MAQTRTSPEFRVAAVARESNLWAIALLSTGEAEAARQAVLSTLTDLLSQGRDEDLQVGRWTRTHLVRLLLEQDPGTQVAAAAADGRAEAERAPVVGGDVEHDEVLAAVIEGLSLVSRRERLALALAEFDDLPDRTSDDLAGAPGGAERARAVLQGELDRLRWPVEVGSALRRLVDQIRAESTLGDVGDFVVAAEAEIARRRRRSRLVAVGVVVAVLVVIIAGIIVGGGATRNEAEAGSSPGRSDPGLLPSFGTAPTAAALSVDGMSVHVGPAPEAEASLPVLADAATRLALPPTLGFTPSSQLQTLAAAGPVPESVRAVFLRHLGGTSYAPVLFVPEHHPAYLQVDTITLDYPWEQSAGAPPRLSPRTIADDRHRLAFVQSDAVVFLDAPSGETRRVALPDTTIRTGGWANSSTWFIAISPTGTWRVEAAGRVDPVGVPGGYGRRSFAMVGGGVVLHDLDYVGEVGASRPMPSDLTGLRGGSIDNLAGWAASGVDLSPNSLLRSGSQGVFAVAVDVSPMSWLLVTSTNRDGERECCSALGWAAQDQILYRSRTLGVDRILVWDTASGDVKRVSDLMEPVNVPGGWSGDFALSP